MQRLEHPCRRGARPAPAIDDARRTESARQVARMGRSTAADVLENLSCKPRVLTLDTPDTLPPARVQQPKRRRGQHAVHMQEIFDEWQRGELRAEIADPVAVDAMAKNQVLRSRRRPDWIDLHEAERLDRRREIDWLRERSRDRVRA